MILKVVGANNSERLFEVLIRYKGNTDIEKQMVKHMMPICFIVSVYQNGNLVKECRNNTNAQVNPNTSQEVVEE